MIINGVSTRESEDLKGHYLYKLFLKDVENINIKLTPVIQGMDPFNQVIKKFRSNAI